MNKRTNIGTRDPEDSDNNGSGSESGNNGSGSGSEPTDTLALFDRKLLMNLKKYEKRAAIITKLGPLDASV